MNNTSDITKVKDDIRNLFDNKSDIDKLESLFDIDFNNFYVGMSEFQIKHFVLNRKEFTNDVHQLQHVKFEIWKRIITFFDMYYQYHKAQAKIELAEGEIEDIESDTSLNNKKKNARITLQRLEIEKNKFALFNTRSETQKLLTECSYFYDAYKELKYVEDLSQKEQQKLWEEGWHIKSAYDQLLTERYGLTPKGFLKLPHEEGGLELLTEMFQLMNANNNQNNSSNNNFNLKIEQKQ